MKRVLIALTPTVPPVDTSTIETPDLYLAAFLCCLDQELLGTRRVGPRVFFQFTKDAELEQLKIGWYSNQATVLAQSYASAIKSLKGLIHSG
jgi:hypothetical protein